MNKMKFSSIITLAWQYYRGNKKIRRTSILIGTIITVLIVIGWLGMTYLSVGGSFEMDDSIDNYGGGYVVNTEHTAGGSFVSTSVGSMGKQSSGTLSSEQYEQLTAGESDSEVSNIRSSYIDLYDYEIIVDGLEYERKERSTSVRKLKFVDTVYNDGKLVSDSVNNSLLNSSGKGVIEKGSSFSGDNASEIIVSEWFLKDYGLSTDILGKQISLVSDTSKTNGSSRAVFDNDTDPNNSHPHENGDDSGYIFDGGRVPILSNFTVVGIINEQYLSDQSNSDNIRIESEFWIPLGALDVDAAPIITVNKNIFINSIVTVLTYPSTDYVALGKSVTDVGKVFAFCTSNPYSTKYYNDGLAPSIVFNTIIEYDNYDSVKSVYYDIYKYNKSGYVMGESEIGKFIELNFNYDVMAGVVTTILMVILSVAILGFYNVLKSNADGKHKYMGTMQAMGASRSDTIKLYFAEVLIAIGMTVLIAVIVSFVLCLFTMMSINNVIMHNASAATEKLLLNLDYFPVASSIIGGSMMALGAVMALSLSYTFFKKSAIQLIKTQ